MNNKNIGTLIDISNKYGRKLLDIKTPIICIFGQGIQTNKYIIQNQIRKCFLDRDYMVSQVIVHRQEELENSYEFPFEIFNSKEDDGVQMIMFNNYVYEICKLNKPDLLIVEVPLGIVPITKEITNDFGSLAFKVSNSINIDIGIMSLYLGAFSTEFFNELEALFLYRFSVDTIFFNLHDMILDWGRVREEKKIKLMNAIECDLDIVKESSKKQNIYILKREHELHEMVDKIEAMLIENSVVNCL